MSLPFTTIKGRHTTHPLPHIQHHALQCPLAWISCNAIKSRNKAFHHYYTHGAFPHQFKSDELLHIQSPGDRMDSAETWN